MIFYIITLPIVFKFKIGSNINKGSLIANEKSSAFNTLNAYLSTPITIDTKQSSMTELIKLSSVENSYESRLRDESSEILKIFKKNSAFCYNFEISDNKNQINLGDSSLKFSDGVSMLLPVSADQMINISLVISAKCMGWKNG